MDTTSGVGRVISSFLILTFTLLFSLLIIAGFNLSITPAIVISFIFMVMVIEDYMYLTIDIRLLGFLAFAGIFLSKFPLQGFFFLLIIGLLYYRIIYLFLIKYIPIESRMEPEMIVDTTKALGFLPSLACGLAIYAFYRIANVDNYPYFLTSFYDSCNVLYAIAFEEPLFFAVLLLPFLAIWILLEIKRHRAMANNKAALPMLGDGDVYVMAVWLATLGLADITMVLFISSIVQILAFLYRDLIKNKIRIGGK